MIMHARKLVRAASALVALLNVASATLLAQEGAPGKTTVTVAIAPAQLHIDQPVIRRLKSNHGGDIVVLPATGVRPAQLASILRAYSATRTATRGDGTRDAMIRSRPTLADESHMSNATRTRLEKLTQRLNDAPARSVEGLGKVKAIEVTLNLPKARSGPRAP